MAYELVYTSAPEGLTRGSSGFCVVACTKGLGPRLVVTLESLSAYKPLYPHYAPNAWENPISRSHYVYEVNGEQQHILSRICFNGVDHTRRSNKLASHLVLNEQETATAQGGPSSLLLQEELFKDASWPIKAEYFMKQKEIPATAVQVQKCRHWESIMGDAGWGGYLAQTFIDSPNKNVYIAYDPDQNKEILPLFHEAISLLPEDLRWKLTFNTYFVNLPVGMSCRWRGCPVDSDAIRVARRSPMNIIIDITRPHSLEQESPLIITARTGIVRKTEEPVLLSDPETEASRAEKKDLPADPVRRSPELSISRKTMQNSGHSFRRPGPDTTADFKKPQSPNEKNLNGNADGTVSSGKKLFFTIASILCILAAVIGGVCYFVSNAKEKQNFKVVLDDYNEISQKYQTACNRRKVLSDKLKRAKTKLKIKELIEEAESLVQNCQSIKEEAEKLAEFQYLFEKYQESGPDSRTDKTPRGLIKDISNLQDEIKRDLSSLKTRLDNLYKQPKKAADEKSPAKATASAPVRPANLSVPAANALSKKIPVKKAGGNAEKNTRVMADDPCYLWMKSEDFHKLQQKGQIDIRLGKINADQISFSLLPEKSVKKVGAVLECTDSNDRRVRIKTVFNKKQGILSFILSEIYAPPGDAELLIRLDGKKELPLYFRLDISKIKPVRKHQDNLTVEIAEKIKLSIKVSSIQMPKIYYLEDNMQCRPAPALRLICDDGRRFDLVQKDGLLIYEGAGPVNKQLAVLDELASIKQRMENDLNEYARKLDEYAGKQDQPQSKPKKEKASQLSRSVNSEKKRLEIAKLFDPKVEKAPAARELREQIGSDQDKIQKLKKKKLDVWVEKYDRLIKKLMTEIPLKDLGFNADYEHTYQEIREKTESELQEIKSALEKQIRTATVALSYGDKEYQQFCIKDIQP